MSARNDYTDLAHAAFAGPGDERRALDEIDHLRALATALPPGVTLEQAVKIAAAVFDPSDMHRTRARSFRGGDWFDYLREHRMTVDYRIGDVRDVMAGIPDGSVDLVASSPPFLALRSYLAADHVSKHAEIGSEANPAAFLDTLLGLTAEWGRALAAHGSIAIELGDSYAGSGGAGGDYNPETGLRAGQPAYKGSNARKEHRVTLPDGRTIQSAGIGNGLARNTPGWPRAKCMALIPQLYAVALAYGINPLTGQPSPAGRWLVRNVIVWHRPNPAVGALGDKVRPSTSYITVATRSKDRWFDLTAVRTPHKDPTDERHLRPTPSVLLNSGRHETSPYMTAPINSAGAPPLDAWFDEYDGTDDTWTLTTQPSKLAHYAMWPAKLAERLILSMCPAEVCRVCGEPRRRMEGRDPAVLLANRERTGWAGRDGREVGADTYNTSFLPSIPTTLGWTDCGCKCPTCDGRGEVEFDTGWDQCMSCGSAPPYRPGLVLDPFAGTGTTLAVADLHGRDAIGIDLNPANRDLYPARYDECKRALYGTPAPMPGQGDLFADDCPPHGIARHA